MAVMDMRYEAIRRTFAAISGVNDFALWWYFRCDYGKTCIDIFRAIVKKVSLNSMVWH